MRIRLSSSVTDDKVVDNAPRLDTTVSRERDLTEHDSHGGDGGDRMRLWSPPPVSFPRPLRSSFVEPPTSNAMLSYK